ncbi:AarF/UbiB family protein [Streptomyces sp. NPDC059095]|uniref:AarF/UbiB family protein n=1 Tax=Streptomyces sp. NPDC059095 TaxID=3346726 RepID=UPI00368B2D49
MPSGRGRRTVRLVGRAALAETIRTASAHWTGRSGGTARARALRVLLEELGPLYVKVGQILATRPDMVPDHIRAELALLNEQVTARPFTQFEPVLAAELGDSWRGLFREIHTEAPLGSASLAQVYRAVTVDGRDCVVKIQRPGSDDAVHGDMAVLRRVTGLIGRCAPHFSEVVDIDAMVAMLFEVMKDELDFTREARTMKKARDLARTYPRVQVPGVILATERVPVQTFADGVPANQLKDDELSAKEPVMTDLELRELFDSLDLNKNGTLTRGELITALRVKARKEDDTSGTTAGFKDIDEAIEFFDQADTDHNKEVTYEEFKLAFRKRGTSTS